MMLIQQTEGGTLIVIMLYTASVSRFSHCQKCSVEDSEIDLTMFVETLVQSNHVTFIFCQVICICPTIMGTWWNKRAIL